MIVVLFLLHTASAVCPADQFFAPPNQPGVDSDKPWVTARCDANYLHVDSNGMPGWFMSADFHNKIKAQTHSYTIPLVPRAAPATTEIPFLGPVGVALTGIPIYAPNEAENLQYGDAKTDGRLDACNGHTGPNGGYHFHARPECPFSQMTDLRSPVVGYALDGYPIREPWVCTDGQCRDLRKIHGSWQNCVDEHCTVVAVKKLSSSWALQKPDVKAAWEKFGYVAGSGDLDQCNGMVGPDGSYSYYATETFPYNVGCYHGVIDPTLNHMFPGWSKRDEYTGPAGGSGHERGSGDRRRRMLYLRDVSERLGVSFRDVRAAFHGLDDGEAVDLDEAAAALGVDERTLVAAVHGHG
jgi:hypothetical protein